jgi:CubicO group peptidase (beta-lactamase class C family)
MIAFIDQEVAAELAERGLPGVTVSWRRARAPSCAHTARATPAAGRPLRPSNHYRIASITNTCVATAIRQLADRGG